MAGTKARQHDISCLNRKTLAATAPCADASLHIAASVGSGRAIVLPFWRLHGGHGDGDEKSCHHLRGVLQQYDQHIHFNSWETIPQIYINICNLSPIRQHMFYENCPDI